jgi:hypothetical protein
MNRAERRKMKLKWPTEFTLEAVFQFAKSGIEADPSHDMAGFIFLLHEKGGFDSYPVFTKSRERVGS